MNGMLFWPSLINKNADCRYGTLPSVVRHTFSTNSARTSDLEFRFTHFIFNKLSIYGTEIPSLNFKDQTLVEFDVNGLVINPYSQLPSIFDGVEKEQLDSFVGNITDGISDGGTAMMAYAKMQFSEVTEIERDHLQKALLRYCELDTMAMVMIWEAWRNWTK